MKCSRIVTISMLVILLQNTIGFTTTISATDVNTVAITEIAFGAPLFLIGCIASCQLYRSIKNRKINQEITGDSTPACIAYAYPIALIIGLITSGSFLMTHGSIDLENK